MARRLGQLVGLARRDDDVAPHFTQRLRHLQAKPARAASDERDLPAQFKQFPDPHAFVSLMSSDRPKFRSAEPDEMQTILATPSGEVNKEKHGRS
jgi:hypothetical protein